MFQQACSTIKDSVYGIRCDTRSGKQVSCSYGTAFMIAPSFIMTAAHVIHLHTNVNNPRHNTLRVIRAPDIDQRLEQVQFIAEDIIRDLALLQINNPRSNQNVVLNRNILPFGTRCGSLGFPLSSVDQKGFHLTLRFQGAFISAFITIPDPSGRNLSFYETDALMYKGSSGCPGFVSDATVFGMHNRSLVDRPRSPEQQGAKPRQTDRFAISAWVPSTDIITFACNNGVSL